MARSDPVSVSAALDRLRIPHHVAIIMDGNGRWAVGRGLPRSAGHRAGRDAVRRTIEACREIGVGILTLYAFSTENWNRSLDEVEALMDLFHESLIQEADELHRSGISLRMSGDLSTMPPEIHEQFRRVEELTHANQALILNVAVNYGARAELVQAARRVAEAVAEGRLRADAIDESTFAAGLYTAGLPDPDLIIRTGFEQRLSNFLLWQAAYSELCFVDIYWPDFDRDHLFAAIAEYQRRQRRFGGTAGG